MGRGWRLDSGLTRRDFLRVSAGAGAGLFLAGCRVQSGGGKGSGEDYPQQSVELVVPFPPGGSTDLIGRAVAQAIEAPLGQTMVVVNREGAAGAVGTREVAGDRADGYRLVFPPSSLFTITPQTVQDPDTISLDDLTIITGLTVENIVLTANTDSPYQTLDDLLEAGRSGQTINYGHSGVGIGTYLAQRVFFAQAGINATDVPFDGGGPSVTALVGNQVDIGASQIAESIEQVEAGELRHLGIFTAERNEFLPDVPTMREQGFDIEVDQVRFIAGPPGLPDNVVSTLTDAFSEAVQDPDYDQLLQDSFIGRFEVSGEELREKIETDYDRYAAYIEEAGIQPEAAS